MKEFFKGKFFTILTVGVTIILAGVAIFTAVRLYQLRQESISPTSPESEPEACGGHSQPQTTECTSLAFTLTQPPAGCNESCTVDSSCEGNLICSNGYCRNSSCVSETDCVCPEPTVTSTPTPTNPPDSTPTVTNTPTPTDQPGSTSTPTPTDTPRGGNDPTPTPTNAPNPTSTPTTQVGDVSPDSSGQALPDAGIATPTIFGIFLGFLLIIASVLLAL